MSPFFYAAGPRPAPAARLAGPVPAPQRGVVSNGRISKLFVGQGYGFIRLTDGREAFFHRTDVREGASINEFAVGDRVTFELLEDAVSGARALLVRRRQPHR